MRLLLVFAPCFLTGGSLMAQGQPTLDGSIHSFQLDAQAKNKAVAMRVFAGVKPGPTSECLPI